ncbi:MspI family type II restriction endonuclease [Fictibacillus nanhaiensis]|uniref:MspI family type II restriction endonuclease n=1 Tax=Fictibacillus nanhaiensis TaxID=742169 RepID=UPI003C135C5B
MTDQFSRSFRGTAHQMIIYSLLEKLKERKYIKQFNFYSKNIRIGYKKEQFYFPFSIEFFDGERWVIQSTTTFPRERMNGYQWNAYHFKKIDESYKKAFVIYPDAMGENDIKKCMNYNTDILLNEIYSSLDGVVSFADFYMMIEEKWLENESVQKRKALQGTAFEKWLIDILTHPTNLDIWNGKINMDLGFNFPFFKKILESFNIPLGQSISKINATDKIPLLTPRIEKSRGGKPKTDIVVHIYTDSLTPLEFTISSKRTSSGWVAINQYSAEVYIDVLKIDEPELKEALYELQEKGAPTQIPKYYQDIIINLLPKYHRALAEWAYAGIGGEGKGIQNAEYFTVYKNDKKELEIYRRDEYIDKILSEVQNGQLGSPFTFTYTGTRGTNIQLRGRVI